MLLLNISTLLCHPHGDGSQYLAKLHKHVNSVVGNTINISHNFKIIRIKKKSARHTLRFNKNQASKTSLSTRNPYLFQIVNAATKNDVI